MHAIKIYAIALPWKEKVLLRRRVEIQIQLFPSPIRSDASSARRAHRLYRCIHTRPIIQRIENVVHLGVSLMMNFRMRAFDEPLLLVKRDQNPLPSITV
jgi:hypothetical protein